MSDGMSDYKKRHKAHPKVGDIAPTLAENHWKYVENVLEKHGVEKDLVGVIGFHYKAAMVHGYGHGREDERNGL